MKYRDTIKRKLLEFINYKENGKDKSMCQEFYWTARLFVDGKLQESRYFKTQEERDSFVAGHEGWKKRGKICVENLDKHLQENNKRQKGE